MVSLRSLTVLLTASAVSISASPITSSPSLPLLTITPPSSSNLLTIPPITLTPPDIPRVTVTHHQPTTTKTKTKTKHTTTTTSSTSAPAHPARHCDYAYCDEVGTSWCFFFVPFTTIDPTKGPMPGETRSKIGPCGPSATASDGV